METLGPQKNNGLVAAFLLSQQCRTAAQRLCICKCIKLTGTLLADPAATCAQGQPCTSIQWGAWAGAGLAAEAPGLLARLARQGHGALAPATGLRVLAAVLGAARSRAPAQLVASVFNWSMFLEGKHAEGRCFTDA